MSGQVRQLPRVMPLAQVAREILVMDVHDAYKAARSGEIHGAFKLGKHWYVSLPAMIAEMGAADRRARSPAAADGADHLARARNAPSWVLDDEP